MKKEQDEATPKTLKLPALERTQQKCSAPQTHPEAQLQPDAEQPAAKDLCAKLLELDSAKRPTAAEAILGGVFHSKTRFCVKIGYYRGEKVYYMDEKMYYRCEKCIILVKKCIIGVKKCIIVVKKCIRLVKKCIRLVK